jgi:hypothetical protein
VRRRPLAALTCALKHRILRSLNLTQTLPAVIASASWRSETSPALQTADHEPRTPRSGCPLLLVASHNPRRVCPPCACPESTPSPRSRGVHSQTDPPSRSCPPTSSCPIRQHSPRSELLGQSLLGQSLLGQSLLGLLLGQSLLGQSLFGGGVPGSKRAAGAPRGGSCAARRRTRGPRSPPATPGRPAQPPHVAPKRVTGSVANMPLGCRLVAKEEIVSRLEAPWPRVAPTLNGVVT